MSTSGEDAAGRAETARERAGELEDRLRRLRSGEPVTQDDVTRAAEAAVVQQRRSGQAHRHAAEAHGEAAEHHRQASELLESAGHADRAAEHRRLAVVDDEAAEVDNASARADEI